MEREDSIKSVEREPIACGHFAIGPDRRISEWDDAAACLLGIAGNEALGKSCACVVSGAGRAHCGPSCRALSALEAGAITGSSRVLGRTADGVRRRLICRLTALPSGGALGRLSRADAAVPDLAYDLAGVAALTARVASEPVQQGLRHALGFLCDVTLADAGEAFVAEPHGKGMALACHQGRFAAAFGQMLRFDAGAGFPGLVLAQGAPVYTTQLADDWRFLRTRVKQEGFGAYVCAPLARHGDTLGCLALAFRRGDIELGRVLDLLHWVGMSLSLVLETALAHLQDQVRAHLHELEDDAERGLPRALTCLLEEMVRLGGADGGELLMRWRGRELRSLVPGPKGASRWPLLGRDALERCPALATGTATILRGRRGAWPHACRETVDPGGAWCCIPLACQGESLGIVRLLHRHLRPSPPNENIAMVERLAALAAEKLGRMREHLAPTAPARMVEHDRLSCDEGAREFSCDMAQQAFAPAPLVHAAHDGGKLPLEIRCFGSLDLSVNGVQITPAGIPRKRVVTLLCILLTHHDQSLCRDALIEMLWPDANPGARTNQFHVLVHELRRLIEPDGRGGEWRYLRAQGDRYTFNAQSAGWIDTLEFRALIERARRSEAAREEQRAAIAAYEAAVELYRGDYLQNEPFAEWCGPVREQLREACLGALHRLSVLWGGQARWDRSIAWARRALQLDPLREEMHRALMYALWAAGRRDQAVRQYEACSHLLRERLDLPPLPETEQLYARIRAAARPTAGH